MASDRAIYIGTQDGLYRANAEGKSESLGLKRLGQVIYPTVDARDSRRLYAGTSLAGMFRSEDSGSSWQAVNEGIIFKMIFSVVQHPASGDLYAGTEPASIFRSSNGGDTWTDLPGVRQLRETIDWTFPQPPHVAHVKHIDISAGAPDRILGAVEEGWVIRSLDEGKTWQCVKDEVEFDCHTVTSMPDNPDRVVATSGRGFFRSEDGGATFAPSMDGLTRKYMTNIVVNAKRPNVLFTSAAAVPPPHWRRGESANAGIFRSENQGKTWEQLKGGLPEEIHAAPRAMAGDPEDPNALFVGFMDGSVWMSEDGGESFRQIITGLPPVRGMLVSRR